MRGAKGREEEGKIFNIPQRKKRGEFRSPESGRKLEMNGWRDGAVYSTVPARTPLLKLTLIVPRPKRKKALFCPGARSTAKKYSRRDARTRSNFDAKSQVPSFPSRVLKGKDVLSPSLPPSAGKPTSNRPKTNKNRKLHRRLPSYSFFPSSA